MLLLATLMSCTFSTSLDQAVVATASPSIVADVGRFGLLPWVFTGYLLGSVSAMPLVGRLSDNFGRKPFLVGGLACFVAGAAGSAVAVSMPQLILFRAIQGLGAGAVQACAFATLADLFTPIERGKYIGLFVTGFSLGTILGPPTGGIVTDLAGWRWVFLITVPSSVAALMLVSRNLPRAVRAERAPFDSLGAICLVAATGALVVGLGWGGREMGWTAPITLGLLAAAAIIGAAFIAIDIFHPGALFPADMFRRREFVLAVASGPLLSAGSFSAVTYLPTFIQTALGSSATASGLVTTPQAVGVFAASLVCGRITARTGRYRAIAIGGAALIAVAGALLTQVEVGMAQWRLAAVMVVLGLGVGAANPVLSMVSQFVVRKEHVGSATAMRFFGQTLGSLLGTAVFGIVLASSYEGAFADRAAPDELGIPAAVVAPFDDPTLRLHKADFAKASEAVRAQSPAEGTLERVLRAQEDAVAVATRHIFVGALAVSALATVLLFGLRDIPLTRDPAEAPPETAASAIPEPVADA